MKSTQIWNQHLNNSFILLKLFRYLWLPAIDIKSLNSIVISYAILS
jgi:hypothetical protein